MKINISVIFAIINSFLFKTIDNNKVIFSSSFNTCYDYNSKYLFEYMKDESDKLKCLYVINDEKKRQELTAQHGDVFINTLTYQGAKEALTAGTWVTSAGLPVYIPFANKKRLVFNVWHGMPLKKIVYDTEEITFPKKVLHKLFFSKGYSYVSITGNKFKKYMSTAFSIEEEKIVVLGQARNDLITKENNKEKILSLLGVKKISEDTKIVLYAPTFRDKRKTEYFPFEDFNKTQFEEWLVKEKILIFLRPHKSEIASIEKFLGENIRLLDNSKAEDIMSILNIFDCLITDYSSIAFDYLILERPMLFLPYDIDTYAKERGFYMEYNEFAAGPKPKGILEFETELKNLLYDKEYYLEQRKIANSIFNEVRKDSCRLHYEFIIENIKRKSKGIKK